MALHFSVVGLILYSYPYLRYAMVRFPFVILSLFVLTLKQDFKERRQLPQTLF